jgi:hypothetical protein
MLTRSLDFFFTDQYRRAWNNSYFPLALADPRLQDLDFNFRGTFEVSEHYMPEKMVPNTIPFAPDGIDNVGPVDADKFWEEVQNARILVGIGSVRNVRTRTGISITAHCHLVLLSCRVCRSLLPAPDRVWTRDVDVDVGVGVDMKKADQVMHLM